MPTHHNVFLYRRMVIVSSLCLLTAAPAHAFRDDADEPVRINARSVEADEKTGAAVYRGNVVAEQGRLSIRADRVEIRTRHSQADRIIATGNPVKLNQLPEEDGEEIRAEARRIVYHVADRKLDMSGEVSLRRGKDLFTGAVLHYDLDAKSLSAAGNDQGDGRIHAVIQPRKRTAEPATAPER